LIGRLRSMPEVENAALTSLVPYSGISSGMSVQAAGRPRGEDVAFGTRYVIGDGYFDSLRLPLLRGREFTAAEAGFDGGPRVAIINEPLARRLFPDGDALGRNIQFTANDPAEEPVLMEIVGIASGTRHELEDRSPTQQLYLPFGQAYVPDMYVHLRIDERVADPSTLIDTVRNEIRAVDAALPVLTLTTLRDFLDENFDLWLIQLPGQLFMWFGVGALFMALVGVYGVTAFLVSRRTREIGVRLALGATRARLTRQIVREGAGVTLVGVVLGLVLAAAVGELLSSMLYEVSAMDPLVFVGATVFLASAAMLACWLPVRRASRIEPTVALRYE